MSTTPTRESVYQEVLRALQIFGDRSSTLILVCLLDQPRRFGDIQQQATGISSRTLAKKLLQLEEAGLVRKEEFKEYPPRTEYCVTQKARDLKGAMLGLKAWAKKYCARAD